SKIVACAISRSSRENPRCSATMYPSRAFDPKRLMADAPAEGLSIRRASSLTRHSTPRRQDQRKLDLRSALSSSPIPAFVGLQLQCADHRLLRGTRAPGPRLLLSAFRAGRPPLGLARWAWVRALCLVQGLPEGRLRPPGLRPSGYGLDTSCLQSLQGHF